jgi:hypothetical protein
LPVVAETIPQKRQKVCCHEGSHDLFDNLDEVDDETVIRDFIVP